MQVLAFSIRYLKPDNQGPQKLHIHSITIDFIELVNGKLFFKKSYHIK